MTKKTNEPQKSTPPHNSSQQARDFHTLAHILKHSSSFLLIAHSRPDPDTIGSCIALHQHLIQTKKIVTIACTEALPAEFLAIFPNITFKNIKELNIREYDVIIAADSVERGFAKHVLPFIDTENQISVLLDHHHDISVTGDITIIDSHFSSTCELLTSFFTTKKLPISQSMATALLMGILGDTGNFQHTNTSPHCLSMASRLLQHGAALQKLSAHIFTNKRLSTLRLWGRAFQKARIFRDTGMITTGLTQDDLRDCEAQPEDVSQVANMLATVPNVRFALILVQFDDTIVKGSFRAEPSQNIDVSQIARRLGGGGHALASGFEIVGRLTETPLGKWVIE